MFSPRVILDHDTLHMWYIGANYGKNNDRIGYARSTDGGITWKRVRSDPVLPVTQEWENGWTYSPYVLRDHNMLKMWYAGNNGFGHIGYAYSLDGIMWHKYAGNPVLRHAAQSRQWDERWIAWPTVVRSSETNGFMMWFESHPRDLSRTQIGFATAPDETSWTRMTEPALTPAGGAWDAQHIRMPRVLYVDPVFMMWYSGGAHRFLDHHFGLASSPDGIHWTKHDAPVLSPGPERWDRGGLMTPEVLLDGSMYRMWYAGQEDTTRTARIGYAISPSGINVTVTHANEYILPGRDSLVVTVTTKDHHGLAFEASIREIDNASELLSHEIASVPLFDDGLHRDGDPNDGTFSTAWIPSEEIDVQVDIVLTSSMHPGARFLLDAVGRSTSRGPVQIRWPATFTILEVDPGDSVDLELILENSGGTGTARMVTTRLSSHNEGISVLDTVYPAYGDIGPGARSLPREHHSIYISPDAITGRTVRLDLEVLSSGIPLWHDSVPLYVRPPWWESAWSYGTFSLVLLLSVSLSVRYIDRRRLRTRIAALERERQIHKERMRISQDMHDEIGASLTEISILTELAKRTPAQREDFLEQISTLSGEVIDNIGQIIWAVNPKNDSLDNLTAYIRRYAVKTLDTAGIAISFVGPQHVPAHPVSAEARRNIFLVVKEALHNIVKHARATSVDLIVDTAGRTLCITVRDDGYGYDSTDTSRVGNGLSNMKTRVESIGGRYGLSTEPGSGTTIRFEVPFSSLTVSGNT